MVLAGWGGPPHVPVSSGPPLSLLGMLLCQPSPRAQFPPPSCILLVPILLARLLASMHCC